MNHPLIFIILSVLLIVSYTAKCNEITADDGLPMEPSTNNVCNVCNCTVKRVSTTTSTTYVDVNCAQQSLSQMFNEIPTQIIGQGNTFLRMSYDQNNITHIGPIAATTAVMSFSCRHCHLETIATNEFLTNVPNIFRLDLSFNRLQTLRNNYFSASLIELYLSSNGIVALPPSLFADLTNLTVLAVANNPLGGENVQPETYAALAQLCSAGRTLRSLDLSGTALETIPNGMFTGCDHLNELYLRNNRFVTVPSDSLLALAGTLHTLDLGQNPLSTIDDTTFSAMKSMQILHVDDGALQAISSGAFKTLVNLKELNLNNNVNLSEFNLASLLGCEKLQKLELMNCSLTTLNFEVETLSRTGERIVHFPALRLMGMRNNPWHCDCGLYRALAQSIPVTNPMFVSEFNARCSTPYDLATDLLVDLLVDPNKCSIRNQRKPPRIIPQDPPAFLRPRTIWLTVASVLAVLFIGLSIGLIIVLVQKKLRSRDLVLDSTIRYTTVRNSTMSAR